jgi:hypothetical protein
VKEGTDGRALADLVALWVRPIRLALNWLDHGGYLLFKSTTKPDRTRMHRKAAMNSEMRVARDDRKDISRCDLREMLKTDSEWLLGPTKRFYIFVGEYTRLGRIVRKGRWQETG